ncbi:MAG: glycosyltransferase family 4 protein [Flavobacteriales bacterium]
MRTVLITAYAADPTKGSEDGTGWNTAVALARANRVILVTRRNNLPSIERFVQEHPDPAHRNMSFLGHDLSPWMMRWKKRLGERGYVAYFYLWQLTLPRMIQRQGLAPDIVHALNFHSDSTPQFLWRLGKPVVWGPVGHHAAVPTRYLLRHYGRSTWLKDRAYNAMKWCLRNLDPFYRQALRRTDHVLAINSAVPVAMRVPSHKVTLLPAVAAEPGSGTPDRRSRFEVISVGRFVAMKGFDLTLHAFAAFQHRLGAAEQQGVRLTLVGRGEEQRTLERIARGLGIEHRIRWVPWVDRAAMDDLYRQAHVMLFPSHEGAGMVVPEAMAHGLPVICLDNPGPGELVGEGSTRVPMADFDRTVEHLADQLEHLYRDEEARERIGARMRQRQRTLFTWEHKARVIGAIYDRLSPLPVHAN